MNEICAICRWFEPIPLADDSAGGRIEIERDRPDGTAAESEPLGRCRTLAPRGCPGGVAAVWPIVAASDWCGAFEHIDPRPARQRKSQRRA
jgi:hypothetical protein